MFFPEFKKGVKIYILYTHTNIFHTAEHPLFPILCKFSTPIFPNQRTTFFSTKAENQKRGTNER